MRINPLLHPCLALLLALPSCAANSPLSPQAGAAPSRAGLEITHTVDWPAFLARQDLVYDAFPTSWSSGSFMGDGQLGAMVYAPKKGAPLNWHIGRSDVYFNTARPEFSGRIPVGDMTLRTQGASQAGTMRLSLWNAELAGTIHTEKGGIAFRSYTHAAQSVQVMELTPDAGEQDCRFEWQPGRAISPRLLIKRDAVPPGEKNPEPITTKAGEVTLCSQPYVTGGGHATAWAQTRRGDTRVLFVAVGYSQKDLLAAQQEALASVRKALATGTDALRESHRAWWHGFWPQSFLALPDAKLEKFYWMQMYKMASGTRADRPALDLMGPWFHPSPWCKIWWNLNIQLSYWAQLGSNRLALGESLGRLLDAGAKNLAKNARAFSADSAAVSYGTGYDCDGPWLTSELHGWNQLCNLPWAVHTDYLQYRYSMDDARLRDRIYPLLKRATNLYLHLLKKGGDGKLHLTTGYSPEYEGQPNANPDCNIDLALLRWGCQTLLDACARLKIDDPQIPQWQDTLANLTPYPVDNHGLRISASVPLAHSHRHYSHLLMIYPLYLMNAEQPENRGLILKSLKHWLSMPSALAGYSDTGAASMYAMLGDGDAALARLHRLLASGRVGFNTHYMEAGPCIETPLSAAAAVHDMLLSSWGDKIRVFPAVPTAWRDVAFRDLRTEGAFLVSAARKDGKTRFVRITSLAGEPCRLRTDMGAVETDRAVPLRDLGAGVLEIGLKKGDSVVLWPAGAKPDLTLGPVDRIP